MRNNLASIRLDHTFLSESTIFLKINCRSFKTVLIYRTIFKLELRVPIYSCSSRRRGFPAQVKFAVNLFRPNEGNEKKLEVKGSTTFITTAITGSLVHTAGWNVLPKPATGSALQHELNPLGAPGLHGSPPAFTALSLLSLPCAKLPAPMPGRDSVDRCLVTDGT